MALVVQKFGGSSVADAARIHRAAARAIRARQAGHRVIVVVSAMGDETDRLINLAFQITPRPSRRELDQLLSTGEQVSIALMAMAIHHAGVPAVSLTGGQIGLRTDRTYGRARILGVTQRGRIESLLSEGQVVIVAGFQGVDEELNVTTLGRGGSDTTAVALAAVLKADACEIYTDVDGVFTADPRIVPTARKLDRVVYEEILELAAQGAQVMHSRSIELAMNYNVVVHVRHSAREGEGTMIVQESPELEQTVVRGAALRRDLARVGLLGGPLGSAVAARAFAAIAEVGLIVDDIIQNTHGSDGTTNISFTIDAAEMSEARDVVQRLSRELGFRAVEIDQDVAKVSVVGIGMRSHAGVAARMFAALDRAGVLIENITTSEIVIGCIVRREQGELALRAVHEEFQLGAAPAGGR
ncbi:MAG: aspartate kinase [Phycisphaerae bacterium]|nr:aspartate kinase [Phycisphaerae bacterium]